MRKIQNNQNTLKILKILHYALNLGVIFCKHLTTTINLYKLLRNS